jgi:hypothetical protein
MKKIWIRQRRSSAVVDVQAGGHFDQARVILPVLEAIFIDLEIERINWISAIRSIN